MAALSHYYCSKGSTGFTLAEVLLVLMILGQIAAFSIPRLLMAQQEGRYNATAKEAMATVAESRTQYSVSKTLTANTWGSEIIEPYINYIAIDTSSQIDDRPGNASPITCSSSGPCYRLHSGGVLRPQICYFSGVGANNAVTYYYDPDGKFTGKQDTLFFFLYFNGRLTSRASITQNVTNSCGTYTVGGGNDPEWFHW